MSIVTKWIPLFGLYLGASQVGAYSWTTPSSMDQEYHPGVKHHRGLSADFDVLRRDLWARKESKVNLGSEAVWNHRVFETTGMALKTLGYGVDYSQNAWSLGVIVEGRAITSAQGSSDGLADPWIYAGWSHKNLLFPVSYNLKTWLKLPLAEDQDLQNPSMSNSAWSGGISHTQNWNLLSQDFSVALLAIYNGESSVDVSESGVLKKRILDEGFWTSIQLAHRWLLLGGMSRHYLHLGATWDGQWGGRFELGDFKASLADFQQIRTTHSYSYEQSSWGLEAGVEVPWFQTVTTNFGLKVFAQWSGHFKLVSTGSTKDLPNSVNNKNPTDMANELELNRKNSLKKEKKPGSISVENLPVEVLKKVETPPASLEDLIAQGEIVAPPIPDSINEVLEEKRQLRKDSIIEVQAKARADSLGIPYVSPLKQSEPTSSKPVAQVESSELANRELKAQENVRVDNSSDLTSTKMSQPEVAPKKTSQ